MIAPYRTYVSLWLPLCAVLLCCGCMPDRNKQTAANETKLAAEGIVALAEGAAAPAFTATASDESTVSLPAAGTACALFFIPAIETPNTSAELLKLSRERDALAAEKIEVYCIAPGSPAALAAYAQKYQIALPLLADPDLSIARLYGCAGADARFAQRTLVCIGADGMIAAYERRAHLWVTSPRKFILEVFGIAPPPKQ